MIWLAPMTRDACARPAVLLRVLVGDSGIATNESLTALLSEFDGLSVFGCAQEPAKVMALIQVVRPQVVILDLQIGGPVGLKTLKEIKNLLLAPVLIVLSHYDEVPLRDAAIAAGADHFLIKPNECERLREVLHGLAQENEARVQHATAELNSPTS